MRSFLGGGRATRLAQRRRTARKALSLDYLEQRTLLATFLANSTTDAVDAHPGSGTALTSTGVITLRSAIMECDALGGDNTITVPAGDYTLTIPQSGADTGAAGELDITSGTLTINGAGAGETVVNAAGLDRVFQLLPNANATLSNLTITGGIAVNGVVFSDEADGGGILNQGTLTLDHCVVVNNQTNATFDFGGGIYNSGTLTVQDSTIASNLVPNFSGAGIYNSGTVTINRSTISGNAANLEGGALDNAGGTAQLIDSTIADNTAGFGGGIENDATLTVECSTFAGNSASFGSGIDTIAAAGDVQVGDSAFANAYHSFETWDGDVYGTFTSEGYNIFGKTGTGSGYTSTDLLNVDAMLGPLQNNGGPTFTQAPLPGSPAIGAGSIALIPSGTTTDQRGFARIVNSTVDIGAVEASANAQVGTTTTLASSSNPSVFGQAVAFTATVAATSTGPGSPTGTVTFDDGSMTLGIGTLGTSNGVTTATFTTAALNVGAGQAITAVYSGDSNYATSTSSALSQTVNQAATTATVASSANPSVYGQSLTFTATVAATSPGAGNPTGAVSFKDGSTTLGAGTLQTSNGVTTTTFSTAALSVGAAQPITAVYAGDANFTTSTSSALIQAVNQAATTTALSVSPSNPVYGQSVTFTSTVSATSPGAGNPTGTVTFQDGSTTLGTGTLSTTSGVTTASFTTSTLNVGSHAITASYGGDANFAGSAGSSSVSISGSPYVVTSTNDSGPGSLRQAILNVNASSSLQTISFAIPGSGVHTISPLSALPTITVPVILDGTSEPGFAVGRPVIELNGSLAGPSARGLDIAAGGSTVRGLVINRFGLSGIYLESGNGNTIQGNYIGTDPTGTVAEGNATGAVLSVNDAITIEESSNNTIGGTTVAARNLISGNHVDGILIFVGSTNNVIEGNFIGTDVTGTKALPNTYAGVRVDSTSDNTIGGTAPGAGNVISNNGQYGIFVTNSSPGTVIQGNLIGTDLTGTQPLGNVSDGILLATM